MPDLPIHTSIQCPSCWSEFHPADILWVSAKVDGDPLLGMEAKKRFLPSRFNIAGLALDELGEQCETIACPSCHLALPRALCDTWPLFVSILGTPSSGKSYYLASAVWQSRKQLSDFNVDFIDADPVANQIISRYEQKLFLNDAPNELVTIRKTERTGDLYQRVKFDDDREVWFAKPFVFMMRPDAEHKHGGSIEQIRKHARALCVYDNAGEHFLPEVDSELSPATDHLAISKSVLFVFDPTQHSQFREKARKHSSDPQLLPEFSGRRQDEVLQEAAKRIRRKRNMVGTDRIDKPLIVIVNKYDVWKDLVPTMDLKKLRPYARSKGKTYLNHSTIQNVSKHVEKLMKNLCPELHSVAKSFSNDVTYIPASPIGASPEQVGADGEQKLLGVRPKNVEPIWSEVPLLYAISKSGSKLIPQASVSPRTSR